jgi:phage/plasmid-associated DNA primase
MQRRVRIINFEQDYRGAKENKDLEDQLRGSIEGVLVSLATGARLYEQTKTIPEPAAITKWSAEYISENDPLTEFLDTMCVLDSTAETSSGPLWKAFEGWAERNGSERWSQTGFGLAMGRRFDKEHKVTGRVYRGVRLKNITDAQDDDE